jgi:flagellar basal-body rod modification protein FlgD
MVGRSVATDSNVGNSRYLGTTNEGEAVYGLQATADMGEGSQGGVFYVQDAAGQLVYQGAIPAGGGTQLIQWEGRNLDGEPMPVGQYSITAESFYGGQQRPATVSALDQIMSVSVGRSGEVTLNLTSGDAMRVDQVKEFF